LARRFRFTLRARLPRAPTRFAFDRLLSFLFVRFPRFAGMSAPSVP
jgi:hypothetical protein